ncbi:MAG TPA: flagellar motor protein MotB [Opitutaceae bacterium]|nr:OmpA family protein [Opitutaceae bacterium]HRE07244.1 flagellar motor protein MotB [Opitutaceae bacterium]
MSKGGGAWKVAYADFVTAMMALFMVLWISSQDKEVLIATSRYFQQPFNSPLNASAGILNLDGKQISESSSRPKSRDEKGEGGRPTSDAKEIDLQFLNSIAKDFYRLLHMDEDLEDRPIDIQVTSDGMRITLFDRPKQPLFEGNTAEFTEWGRFIVQSLAWMIDRNRFQVVIEGHTRSGLEMPDEAYSTWELSTDRANAARRALTHYAVDPKLINRVTGYSDTRTLPLEPPESDSNQRVTLSLSLVQRGADRKSSAPPPTPASKPPPAGLAPAPVATVAPKH